MFKVALSITVSIILAVAAFFVLLQEPSQPAWPPIETSQRPATESLAKVQTSQPLEQLESTANNSVSTDNAKHKSQNLGLSTSNQTQQRSSVSDNVCLPQGRNKDAFINHFGQDLRLNGANLAWSSDPTYARDVGTTDFNIYTFRRRFAEIADAGGNSARWWMHTNGTVTPHMDDRGYVTGLSRTLSNDVVIGQVRQILDAAWEQGIVLNITLFSFDLMCSGAMPERANKMLNIHHQSYIDNALTPLVKGLKDHPALFAWEIFNEAEGMTTGTAFFDDPSLQNCAPGLAQPKWTLQRFVNHTAARIHEIDRNVKVTTSVGHPRYLKDYTNSALTTQPFSRRHGTLDFYQIHWYSEELNPFMVRSEDYRLDRPILVGEFHANFDNQSGTSGDKLGKKIFSQGYSGSWVWSLTSEPISKITPVIKNAMACAPPINKKAIESCIAQRSSSCYSE